MSHETTLLASLVLQTAKLHEDSFDKDAATCAKGQTTDYSQFYKLSLRGAANVACGAVKQEDLAEAVYLLLKLSWNDAQAWAEDILPTFHSENAK